MSDHVERTIRIVDADKSTPKQVTYWRARSATERLLETLKLHREGNDLFHGGNSDFVYVIRVRDVGDP